MRLRGRGVHVGVTSAVIAVTGLTFAGSAHAALRAPRLQLPAAATSVQALPTFNWGSVPGAAQYEFQLAADTKFSSIVLGTGKGRGSQRTRNTSATLEKSVPDGTYFWRVRAISKKDRAGAWSSPRRLIKAWTTVPTLVAPSDEFAVVWPSQPLVLRWSPVQHATRYLVTIASDPTLAQSVIGTANKPIETYGNVYSPQGTLPSGRYYWAITPVDASGQRGTRSRVASFTWTWPTATTGSVLDLNATAQVFDPLLRWDTIPGAARYEVEINPDDDFSSGSRVCCKERVLGTSLSPMRVLPNNNDFAGSSGYYWRVRAFDADGNPGQWNNGPTFEKAYDNVVPTVPNLAVQMLSSPDAASASPLVTWDPVPGATQYQLQWTTYTGGFCGWSNASAPIKTSSTAWAPLSPNPQFGLIGGVPGGIGITVSMRPNGTIARSGQPFNPERAYITPPTSPFANAPYCLRVRALSDDSFRENDNAESQVISQWTQLGGDENAPAFTYGGPPATPDPAPVQLPAPTYLSPLGTDVVRTPVLRWAPVTGARRYFVILARDSNFTNVIDAAFTAMPAYVPNLALEDETTSYFWAVIPSSQTNGGGISGGPKSYNPQTFRKLSIPPTPVEPVGGADVSTQPTFRWTAAESAQKYRVQVSSDPQFGSLIDDQITASTAYTSQTTYPADTALYWRVRAEQQQVLQFGERVELRWSATGTFRRRLPAPTPAADNPTSGTLIPAFLWSAVPGAVSYDLHVDQADGIGKDFNVKSTAFAPTQFYGTGIFRYKVRANFATRTSVVSSGYFAPQAFTRLISAPTNPRITRTKTRLVFRWNSTAAATRYLVEVSRSDSFSQILDSVRTDHTSWAPDLSNPGYKGGGALYWRVASIDSGNNVGAYANRDVGVKTLTVRLRGSLRRDATRAIGVTVRSSGKAVKGAKVKASGAGVTSKTKTTGRRGTTTMGLRPTKTGKVTFTVSHSGYRTKAVTLRVR